MCVSTRRLNHACDCWMELGDYQSFLDFIKGLPSQPQPEIFGFHQNADISKESTEVNRLLASLLLAVPDDSSSKTQESTEGEGEEGEEGPPQAMTPDDVMLNISADILSKLPNNYQLDLAQLKYPVTYFESMNTVLCQVRCHVSWETLKKKKKN